MARRRIPLSEEAFERARQRRLQEFGSEEDFERARQRQTQGMAEEDVPDRFLPEKKPSKQRRRTREPDISAEAQRRARRATQGIGGARRRSLLAGGARAPLGFQRSLLGF